MPAGDIVPLKGPYKILRPTADGAKDKGHVEILNHSIGFWLHDTPDTEVGSFCIAAGLVRMNKSVLKPAAQRSIAVTAGAVIYKPRTNNNIQIGQGNAQLDGGSPGTFGVVYEDAAADATHLLIVFEHH